MVVGYLTWLSLSLNILIYGCWIFDIYISSLVSHFHSPAEQISYKKKEKKILKMLYVRMKLKYEE
jgi:hypothetical protein